MIDELKIKDVLSVVVGKPLWRCTRAADMACFQFGARNSTQTLRGEPCEVGDYALNVQCSWRITQSAKVVVGSNDLYYPASYSGEGAVPDDFDWTKDPNLRDARLRALFKDDRQEFPVESVEVNAAGAFTLHLTAGTTLEICPCNSTVQEHWRFFSARKNQAHFVVYGDRVTRE